MKIHNIDHFILSSDCKPIYALQRLQELASNAILFLVDDAGRLLASLTDGDIRRGLLKGLTMENHLMDFVQSSPIFLDEGKLDIHQIREWRSRNYMILPVVNADRKIVDVINLKVQKSFLPIDATIMAGGRGSRLQPLTDTIPKPLLEVGGKPIIEYNIDRLKDFGVKNFNISIRYLGGQIIEYFKDGAEKGIHIKYIEEDIPLGTMGAVSMIDHFENDYQLVMNSDLLTNIDIEEMFVEMVDNDADMVVATTPYEVRIPYGVVETVNNEIVALKEKPTYTYYSNAGIYLIKKEHLAKIPKEKHYNATDLIEELYSSNHKVLNFPILGYWLDVGKHEDFKKAQEDVKHLKF